MKTLFQPGKLVSLRGREWVVLPSDDPGNRLIVKPLGGSDDEITGVFLPLDIPSDRPSDARFAPPAPADLGDIGTARLVYDAARLAERRNLARHFVQRKRADVATWLDEDTPFPRRDTVEWSYDLSRGYTAFFDEILAFARRMVVPDGFGRRQKRVQYWTALALLRGVMSSPAAGVKMLTARLDTLAPCPSADPDATEPAQDSSSSFQSPVSSFSSDNPVRDLDFGFEGDNTPTQVVEQGDWTDHQRRQLRHFAEQLAQLGNIHDDQKLYAASVVLEEWLAKGFKPVVFCRYIETANYLGKLLEPVLRKKFPKLDLRVVTSEDPDDLRRQHIAEMAGDKPRVLIATDCLSEGINLQELFTGVLHYDLPWNPNRLEQREGRVDRFGQKAAEVKTCLVYGADNPIDGIVLDVLLRKVREIKRATGINVPFPEDSQSIIDTITQALLLNPDRRIARRRGADQQMLFDFTDFGEAAARETASRSIFAQNAIKAQDIAEDLLAGGQTSRQSRHLVKVSFESPTPEGYLYLGRNNRFVEQLCQLVMANTLARRDRRAARAAVIRTRQVTLKTTLMLFRCRNVIEQGRGGHQIVAEEMLLWGWRGTPGQKSFLSHAEARDLLAAARATSDLSPQARAAFLENELSLLDRLDTEFTALAEAQSRRLVAAHERFSALMDKQRFQVVYPVLPMDLLGLYVLLPE